MQYKTTVEVERDGSLVMTDGTLSANGDMTFAYHALVTICNDQANKGHTFKRDEQFKVQPVVQSSSGFHSDRLKVTINPEFAKDAIAVLKKEYPGLTIRNEEQLERMNEQNHKFQ
ncbi:hypothetical protein OQJ13_00850 [Legionella sp. PATHC035]|uniref:hypothetical protein n=1 Tax=Legionella sp. PATHC035 TaxID=2992040 RepID=UPI0022449231|nr:hypothetical protein [Legionella sp. PATHC035]MCW8407520.1 hypothetical protein [Legionella sp. PATHC035]